MRCRPGSFVLAFLLASLAIVAACGTPPLATGAAPPPDAPVTAAPARAEPAPIPAPTASASTAEPTTPTTTSSAAAEPKSPPVVATDPSTAQDPTPAPRFVVRLRGLRAELPWTDSIALYLKARAGDRLFQTARVVDGVATFSLPDWAATDTTTGRLVSDDGNHLPLRFAWEPPFDLSRELVLDVAAAAVLSGRVVDGFGAGVAAARVTVFRRAATASDQQDPDRELAHTNTTRDGHWRLQVPHEGTLLVVAAALAPAPMQRPVQADEEVPDDGTLRHDLLPVAANADAAVGRSTTVADLLLQAPSPFVGTVRWHDGRVVARAIVQAAPRGGRELELAQASSALRPPPRLFVVQLPDGSVLPAARAVTDDTGRFTLPNRAGANLDVRLMQLDEFGDQILLAPGALATITDGAIVLPQPVLVRALQDGAIETDVAFVIEGHRDAWPGTDGTNQVVPNGPGRVRAMGSKHRSAFRALGLADAGSTVDLELLPLRTALVLTLPAEVAIQALVLEWERDDGISGRERLLPDDGATTVQLPLPPGRYRLVVTAAGLTEATRFLLPSEHQVELDEEPVTVTMPAVFGGSFRVIASDRSGAFVGGRLLLLDAQGVDRTPGFLPENSPEVRAKNVGELVAGGPNRADRVLPPGNYELLGEFDGHGPVRQRVQIRPREVGEVYLRLP